MKTAIIILYGIVVVLAITVVMQYLSIQKLSKPAPGENTKKNDNGTGTFGEMVDAVKDKVKTLEIKADF